MLVLSRREQEKIVIPTEVGNVVLQVVRVDGKKVRIAIDAPRAIDVYRQEVFDVIQSQGGD